MSYRPPSECLSESIDNLLEGLSNDKIDALRKIVRNREETDFDSYSTEHIYKLYYLLESLESARRQLRELRQ